MFESETLALLIRNAQTGLHARRLAKLVVQRGLAPEAIVTLLASSLGRTSKLVIECQGDELRIRPAQRRMGDVLGKFAKFSPDFMTRGRGENIEGQREAL